MELEETIALVRGRIAQITDDGRTVFDGQNYTSLSTAARMARKSVIGSPSGRKYPQTNGWLFWQIRAGDGRLVYLDELRRQLYQAGGPK